jgi:hypothetical protein
MANKVERTQSKAKEILPFLCVLLLIMLDSNTYISMYFLSFATRIVLLLVAIFTLFCVYKKIKIAFNIIIYVSLFSLFSMISVFINKDSSNYFYSLIIIILIGGLFSTAIGLKEFAYKYNKVMFFICVYSLLLLILSLVFKNKFINHFPKFNHYGSNYSEGYTIFINGVFSNIHLTWTGDIEVRNYGPFTEPGKYQFYILLAFIIEVFYFTKEQRSIKRTIVYLITCISTFSTAGIIFVLLLLVLYLISNTNDSRTRSSIFVVITLLLISVINIERIDFIKNIEISVFKITNKGISYMSRWGSLVGNIKSWLEKPLFGWGYSGFYTGGAFYREYTLYNTNTLFSIFAMFGIVPGVTFLYGLCRIVSILEVRKIEKYLIFLIIFLSTCNELLMDSIILNVFIFSAFQTNILRTNNISVF